MASVIERQPRPPLWRDVRVLKWVVQFVILGGVIALIVGLIVTAQNNVAAQSQTISFDFLSRPIGITLSEGFNTLPDSAIQALGVGMVNMFRLMWTGILAATVLGTIIGVARLSSNWIVNKTATGYIELIRNIPLLVQIIFWQVAIRLLGEATAEKAIGVPFGDETLLFFSAKGFAFPWMNPTTTRWQWAGFMVGGLIATYFVYKWRIRVQESGRGEAHVGLWVTAAIIVSAIIGWWAHPLMGFVGVIFGALESLAANIPTILLQLILAGVSILLGYLVIRQRLNTLRTPSGYGKFSDDDWYRIIMAGLVGLLGAVFFLLVPQVSEIILGRADLFGKSVGAERIFNEIAVRFSFSATEAPFDPNLPRIAEGRFTNYDPEFGKVVSIGFAAMWLGLVIYTAAFIGEAVRAGVLAVAKGQTEAGLAIGLRRSQLLRMIVLPQAFRVVLPPIGNQYLNLAKNTSLAIAVGYSDLVQVGGTVYNQTGQTLVVFLIWMGFYSLVSLTLSSGVNYWNNKLKLVER